MTFTIIPGDDWGIRPWGGAVHSVPFSTRTHFLVHHDGDKEITRTGNDIPQAIDGSHHGNGWSGIGYNFVVDQAGNIYEGRGWKLVGAHCPGKNQTGIGVQVAIGGDQEPSDAAKAAVVWLYGEVTRLRGRPLIKGWHGQFYPTACAGSKLNTWVKGGMALKSAPVTHEAPSRPVQTMPSRSEVRPTPTVAKLTEDGDLGPLTIRRWQQVMKTPVDGVISPVSTLIKAVQKVVKVKDVDGRLGPLTTKAIQRRLGVAADGDFGPLSVKALQHRLNTGKF